VLRSGRIIWTNATRSAKSLTGAIDPMTEFVLRLDLSDHRHPDNLPAEHAKVREWLGLAVQQLGSNLSRKGDLRIPIWNASEGASHPVTIGSWAFTEDETRNPAEAA
jgi:hypothetical protein